MNIATPVNTVDSDALERIAKTDLAPIARRIDEDRVYPEPVMRAFGAAGAYGTHLGGADAPVDLAPAILAMARGSEECLSTGFCMWCQIALGYYIASSDNETLKRDLLPKVDSNEEYRRDRDRDEPRAPYPHLEPRTVPERQESLIDTVHEQRDPAPDCHEETRPLLKCRDRCLGELLDGPEPNRLVGDDGGHGQRDEHRQRQLERKQVDVERRRETRRGLDARDRRQ